MNALETKRESRWLKRAIGGDEAAFAQLVEAYQKPVYNLCYRMLGDPFEAEDAAQETFLKAFRNLRRYDPERPFRTWLLSIASHHCIDRLRRRRLKLVPLTDLLGEKISGGEADPETAVIQSERVRRIDAALEQIPPRQRAGIILRYWYDLSYREIGETLGLSTSAVKSLLHRARRELAARWSVGEPASAALAEVENETSAV